MLRGTAPTPQATPRRQHLSRAQPSSTLRCWVLLIPRGKAGSQVYGRGMRKSSTANRRLSTAGWCSSAPFDHACRLYAKWGLRVLGGGRADAAVERQLVLATHRATKRVRDLGEKKARGPGGLSRVKRALGGGFSLFVHEKMTQDMRRFDTSAGRHAKRARKGKAHPRKNKRSERERGGGERARRGRFYCPVSARPRVSFLRQIYDTVRPQNVFPQSCPRRHNHALCTPWTCLELR